MPALQTTYTLAHPKRVAGMQSDMTPCTNTARIADVVTGFGVVVVQGAQDRSVRLPTATAAPFRGITLLSHDVYPVAGQAVDTYPVNAMMSVMTKGVVAVLVSAAVVSGGLVYFDTSGNISSTNTGTLIPNAIFDSSGTAGTLVDLRLQ